MPSFAGKFSVYSRRSAASEATKTNPDEAFPSSKKPGAAPDKAAETKGRKKERPVPRILSKLKPLISGWLSSRCNPDPDECFLPCPQISLLIDQPPKLTCQICQDSELSPCPGHDDGDSVPSILPCGHVFGQVCLSTWLGNHNSCPACRMSLVYPECGHAVPERPLTAESIHVLPRTLPDGGHLPDKCDRCLKHDLTVAAVARYRLVAEEFLETRALYEQSSSLAQGLRCMEMKDILERIMVDEVHLPHMTHVLRNW